MKATRLLLEEQRRMGKKRKRERLTANKRPHAVLHPKHGTKLWVVRFPLKTAIAESKSKHTNTCVK